MTRITYITIVLLTLHAGLHAQTDMPSKSAYIGVNVGWALSQTQDKRLSNQYKHFSNPVYQLSFGNRTATRRYDTVLSFQYDNTSTTSRSMGVRQIQPEVFSRLQWYNSGFWIGPTFESSTLLLSPKGKGFSNSPISYTISNGLGIAVNRQWTSDDAKLSFDTGIESSLVSYVIRPAFGHPYPEGFLEDGTFHPTRAGMGRTIARSGKWKTPKGFQSIRIKLGLVYQCSERLAFSLNYNLGYMRINHEQSLRQISQIILLGIQYAYKASN